MHDNARFVTLVCHKYTFPLVTFKELSGGAVHSMYFGDSLLHSL